MRRWSFYFREGFGIFTRSGVAGMLTILAFSILAGVGNAIWAANDTLVNIHHQLLSMFELEAYLKTDKEETVKELSEWIEQREGVTGTQFISVEEAANRFAGQFGEELFGLLEENPLPASIIIQYDPDFVSREKLQAESEEISQRAEIDEIIYEGDLLERLEVVASKVRNRMLIAAVFIAIIALVLTLQSIRVAGRAVKPWVRAVILVGGSETQLVMPFVVSGALSGLAGGLLGIIIEVVIQTILAQQGNLVPPPGMISSLGMLGIIILIGGTAASFAAPRGLEHKPLA